MAKRTLKADTLVEELFRSGYLKKEIQLETFFFEEKDDQGMNEKWNDKRIERKPRGDEIEEIESV